MGTYKYTASKKDGEHVSGTIAASTQTEALEHLTKQGLKPILVRAESNKKKGFSLNMNLGSGKVKLKDKVVFSRQLATMVSAGVPLTRALRTLSEQTDSKSLQEIMPEVVKDVEGGLSLADALAKHPKGFDDIYVNMVRAGETGGILEDVLNKLANQQEKDAKIRGKVKSAMVYPIVIIVVTVGAFFFLMTTIVPKIGGIARDLGGENFEFPIQTKITLAVSDFLVAQGPLIVIGTVVSIILLSKYFKSKKGRPVYHKLLLKIPIISTILTKVAVARFARIFSALSSAGVPIVESLKVTSKAINNAVIEAELNEATKAVTAGKPLSVSLTGSKTFPPIVAQMMTVGEETGEIGTVLIKIADFYEDEVERAAETLASVIEPVMIIVLGGMVGFIAFSIFGPLSELTSAVRNG